MSRTSKVHTCNQVYLYPPDGDSGDLIALNTIVLNRDSEEHIDTTLFHRDHSRAQTIFLINNVQMDDYGKLTTQIQPVSNPTFLDLVTEKPVMKTSSVGGHKKYTIKERIQQVHDKSNIHLVMRHPKQDFNHWGKPVQDSSDKYEFTIVSNYQKNDDGSLEMTNKALLKKQKCVLGYLIKQFGSVIMSGKSIMSISLPISIFEPRSLLERLADSLCFAPHFLEKGGLSTDPVEQFRYAFTFYISAIATDLNPEKPFNPILGETFQGIIGGCPVYIEQVSHHPPMAAFQVIGKNFTIEGTFEFFASISTNSVKTRKIGSFKVIYKNTGAVVQVLFPVGVMSGTAFGKRVWQNQKKMQVFDLKNGLYSEIDFDKSELAKKRKELKGYFSSNIYKVSDKFCTKAKQDLGKGTDVEIKFKEKDSALSKLDAIEGSWLECVSFNNKVYWSAGNPWPYKVLPFDNPLPSDSNFRLDLLYLKDHDELKAQEYKVIYEEEQRKDKKLRDQIKSKNYK